MQLAVPAQGESSEIGALVRIEATNAMGFTVLRKEYPAAVSPPLSAAAYAERFFAESGGGKTMLIANHGGPGGKPDWVDDWISVATFDGNEWLLQERPEHWNLYVIEGLAYIDESFVALADRFGQTELWWSSDGTNWVAEATPPFNPSSAEVLVGNGTHLAILGLDLEGQVVLLAREGRYGQFTKTVLQTRTGIVQGPVFAASAVRGEAPALAWYHIGTQTTVDDSTLDKTHVATWDDGAWIVEAISGYGEVPLAIGAIGDHVFVAQQAVDGYYLYSGGANGSYQHCSPSNPRVLGAFAFWIADGVVQIAFADGRDVVTVDAATACQS